jgi:hypothetical protein
MGTDCLTLFFLELVAEKEIQILFHLTTRHRCFIMVWY